MAEFLIIGVGNPYRRDDAVGLLAARAMKCRFPSPVRILECSGEGTELMSLLEGCHGAIIVDAVQSGHPPGTLHEFDAGSCVIPSDFFHYSTHAFSVAEAIELMRVLGNLPPCVTLVGIEGADFGAGEGLSRIVQAQFETLLASIERAWLHLAELSSSRDAIAPQAISPHPIKTTPPTCTN